MFKVPELDELNPDDIFSDAFNIYKRPASKGTSNVDLSAKKPKTEAVEQNDVHELSSQSDLFDSFDNDEILTQLCASAAEIERQHFESVSTGEAKSQKTSTDAISQPKSIDVTSQPKSVDTTSQPQFGLIPSDPRESSSGSDNSGTALPNLQHKRVNIGRQDDVGSPLPDCDKLIQRRKFPGPAGILPELGSPAMLYSPSISQIVSPEGCDSPIDSPAYPLQELTCSQNSANFFQAEPWMNMIRDINPKILSRWNITSVTSSANKTVMRKLPLLCVLIYQLDSPGSTGDRRAVFKDNSGELCGTVLRDVVEKYLEISVGCVVVLQQVILTLLGKRHYLTVTLNNLVCIYYPPSGKRHFAEKFNEDDLENLKLNALLQHPARLSRCSTGRDSCSLLQYTPKPQRLFTETNPTPRHNSASLYSTTTACWDKDGNFSRRAETSSNNKTCQVMKQNGSSKPLSSKSKSMENKNCSSSKLQKFRFEGSETVTPSNKQEFVQKQQQTEEVGDEALNDPEFLANLLKEDF